ncbi:MAG TPA: hypothetical protein PLK76_00730 [bacterium]|nr:hypothetical protein [bacterium]
MDLIKHPNPEIKNGDNELLVAHPDFLEQLKKFPLKIQRDFMELSRCSQLMILQTEKVRKSNKETNKSRSFYIETGTEEQWEEISREIRHEKGDYSEEEIEEMDLSEIELIIRQVLHSFFRYLKEREGMGDRFFVDQEVVKELLNLLWSGRKENSFTSFEPDYYKEIRAEYDRLNEEKRKLVAELQKMATKKLNRPMKKRFTDLNALLVQEFGYIFRGVDGSSYESEWGGAPKKDRLKILKSELSLQQSEITQQKTLAYALKYFSAEEFAVIFNEILESRASFLRKKNPKFLNDAIKAIESWFVLHESEKPLKEKKELTGDKKEKIGKIIKHFWRLFNSYLRLLKEPSAEEQQLSGTVSQLSVALNLLNKINS